MSDNLYSTKHCVVMEKQIVDEYRVDNVFQ